MTEIRTENFQETQNLYAEYEYNGTVYGVNSVFKGDTEYFYFVKNTDNGFTNFNENAIFTLEHQNTALIRLDLTVKNNTAYVFYATYNTQNDTMNFYIKTTTLDTNGNWTEYTDTTINNEIIPDLEFGYDPYVADNGYIYVSYATNENPTSYKVRYFDGTNWNYVADGTVNNNNEDVTFIAGSVYNNNVYIAYSYIDTNTEQSAICVKQANNGKWETVSTPENINNNTVVDINFNYNDDGLYLDYSVATITNYSTKITSKNLN